MIVLSEGMSFVSGVKRCILESERGLSCNSRGLSFDGNLFQKGQGRVSDWGNIETVFGRKGGLSLQNLLFGREKGSRSIRVGIVFLCRGVLFNMET